ncbi:hypothetical protein M406DRAFT_53284 [Cryphonectria parasitica EP155]|uniref:3-hydroxyisobutyrate dehydrogenase n=1 Tax=Cryphonectria parasitica (strain ATCC 38755 / EP155) TaxID=660469 RepID=A0A9P5CQ10_CRYP1|nr:uncharacterized protein M406DRAFT_53284 [Cryphonectria parasitica EP155]KAF3766713.1 hypothetical protein M406DRAFT_53284 [Cryphonectria parasitica EP155]
MAATKPAVSFLGLGAMGFGMATHLVQEGYPVTGFDVWAPTLERFTQAGGSTASTPAEAVQGRDFCVCMVATAAQAQAVLFDGEHPVANALPRGATLLLCSTVPCAFVQGLARQLVDIGRDDIYLIDSPVSGGAIRAADGTLSIMAGGTDEALEKGRALLQALSDPQKLYLVKGGVGAGSNMKMCHQVLAANQILAASEALGFASHLGLDLKKSADAILQSEGHSFMLENRLPRLLAAPDFKPVASAVTIILKDAGIVTSEARRYKFPTPLTSVAEQVYLTALNRGWGADDDACLPRLYSEGVGKVGPIVSATTGGPVSSQDEAQKLQLVVDLLRGIHLCSAAETIAFASRIGLELDQVFGLCVNAAGGSYILSSFGPEMITACKTGKAGTRDDSKKEALKQSAQRLQRAVDEAQRLKMPLFLGNQALHMIQTALLQSEANSAEAAATQVSPAAVIKAWLG